jgi:GNAT superfamily N-acetyltransferase
VSHCPDRDARENAKAVEDTLNFNVEVNALETKALSLEYFLVPWDTELMARPVAQIRNLDVRDFDQALSDFGGFAEWKNRNRIAFATAKIAHRSTTASQLVQAVGYRFVELNFRPEITLAPGQFPNSNDFEFQEAQISDKAELCDMASRTFRHTRFHTDPLLGQDIGDFRYRAWMENAFDQPHQQVMTCTRSGAILAFFVQEFPRPDHVFWSLVGLAPGLHGHGLGKIIWPALLNWLQRQGFVHASTSISSLNMPVLNLYARLGFRFPEPDMIFHWHRRSVEA